LNTIYDVLDPLVAVALGAILFSALLASSRLKDQARRGRPTMSRPGNAAGRADTVKALITQGGVASHV
jgi:hypothetical protein